MLRRRFRGVSRAVNRGSGLCMLERMGRGLYGIMTLPVPAVALLNGAVVGGGCELAAACDYRFASKDAIIGFIQGNL